MFTALKLPVTGDRSGSIAEIVISTRRGISNLPWPNLLRSLEFILKIGYHPKTRIFYPCAEVRLPVRSRCFGSVKANAICSQCRIPWFDRWAPP
jgi:hypothetical protein